MAERDRGRVEGELYKQLGMRLVDEAVSDDWKAAADDCIRRLAETGMRFTADDVRAQVGDPPGHPNAMGPRFNAAANRGLIEQVGYQRSNRPSLHRHPIAVWIGTTPSGGEDEPDVAENG